MRDAATPFASSTRAPSYIGTGGPFSRDSRHAQNVVPFSIAVQAWNIAPVRADDLAPTAPGAGGLVLFGFGFKQLIPGLLGHFRVHLVVLVVAHAVLRQV